MADKFDELVKSLGYLVVSFNELEVALGGVLMYLLSRNKLSAYAEDRTIHCTGGVLYPASTGGRSPGLTLADIFASGSISVNNASRFE